MEDPIEMQFPTSTLWQSAASLNATRAFRGSVSTEKRRHTLTFFDDPPPQRSLASFNPNSGKAACSKLAIANRRCCMLRLHWPLRINVETQSSQRTDHFSVRHLRSMRSSFFANTTKQYNMSNATHPPMSLARYESFSCHVSYSLASNFCVASSPQQLHFWITAATSCIDSETKVTKGILAGSADLSTLVSWSHSRD